MKESKKMKEFNDQRNSTQPLKVIRVKKKDRRTRRRKSGEHRGAMAKALAEVLAGGDTGDQTSAQHASVFQKVLQVVLVLHEQGNQTVLVVVMQHNGSIRRFRCRFDNY